MPYPPAENSYDIFREGGTTLEISALIDLVLTVRGFRARLDERLRAINQSAARMETLAAIVNMQGPVSQRDLARRLRVEGATITRMIDVLQDMDIRQGIKAFSDWPTIPQLYVKGEFVGGSDIMMEMYEAGELQELMDDAAVAKAS